MASMIIEFTGDLRLEFETEPTPLAELWLSKMAIRHHWNLDDACRFYNFDQIDVEKEKATELLQDCINTINSYDTIIEKSFTSIEDQDLLNYLHSIFERYHGLLDKQDTGWWKQAPEKVKKALANLNIAVHRAENVGRSGGPRFVCTWFGMPKDSQLDPSLIESHGRLSCEFGGVYLNYTEIGKTLEDLSLDNDQYISKDAFQPFRHYSADFTVKFYDEIADVARAYRYFETHRSFFEKLGIMQWDDYRTKPYRFKVAQLKSDLDRITLVDLLSKNQHITNIHIQ